MQCLIYAALITYALWVFYLAVMNLARAKRDGKLSKPALLFAYPVLIVGFALDAAVNFTICTVAFLDPPHELTVTERLKRYSLDKGWRKRVASWLADHLLDDFDPSGKHI